MINSRGPTGKCFAKSALRVAKCTGLKQLQVESLFLMSMNGDRSAHEDFAWRRYAPLARRITVAVYSWQAPHWSFALAVIAGVPFVIAAALSPALLSLSPTVEMLAPIAEARAVSGGEANMIDHATPFYLLLLLAGEFFADTPGRIHLAAKALGAMIALLPFAYFASTRLPILAAILLTAALAAYVSAPFAGPAELGVALLLVCGVAFVSASVDDTGVRARFEGLMAGAMLFALWLLNPLLALAGFIFLSACPFLSGRCGLWRYGATLLVFAVLAAVTELAMPGMNIARAAAVSGVLNTQTSLTGHEGAFGLSGVVFSVAIVLIASAIFGGREHAKSWATAAGFAVITFTAARITGANAIPVFIMAASLACFSSASPFYDGVFRNHDRASVAVALMTAAITFLWAVSLITHSAGQFSLQYQTANAAPENIRTELALVQPGGPSIARWIEEGRFSTPEARELFALAPVDQSAMLLEAASQVRVLAGQGMEVAILTGADTACVLAEGRVCHADGPSAATAAKVVFVPRLELDPATTEAKGRAEALLFTEFKLIERTALWEIWVRRGSALPGELLPAQNAGLYR